MDSERRTMPWPYGSMQNVYVWGRICDFLYDVPILHLKHTDYEITQKFLEIKVVFIQYIFVSEVEKPLVWLCMTVALVYCYKYLFTVNKFTVRQGLS